MKGEIRASTKEAVYTKYAELCRRRADLSRRAPEPNRDDVFEEVKWDKKKREWVLRFYFHARSTE